MQIQIKLVRSALFITYPDFSDTTLDELVQNLGQISGGIKMSETAIFSSKSQSVFDDL